MTGLGWESFAKKGITVRHIDSPVDFLKAWNVLLETHFGPVAVLNDPISATWLDLYENICWIPDDGGRAEILRAQVGFTGASLALADTGTLVLAEDSGFARLVSNMVSCHVALIPENRLVANWQTALERLDQGRSHRPRILSFISGPSQTADIQGQLVRGMHGPTAVEAWIVPAVEGPLTLT